MLLISHIHPDILQRDRIPDQDLLDALPPSEHAGRTLAAPFLVPAPGPSVDLRRIDWPEWQRLQGDVVDQLRQRLDMYGDRPVAYFGATYIPLALDFGYRLGTFRPVVVFQHHHKHHHWKWMANALTVDVHTDGVPTEVDPRAGEVVVRVSTSYTVSDASVAELVPDTIAEVKITVTNPNVDALASPQDLDAVVHKFQEAMEHILRFRPGTRTIHLFVAGPTGLALRLGTAIPTSAPKIQTYQFDKDTQRHRPALVLPPPRRRSEKDRISLLLLAALPSTEKALRIGKEHDEIQRRLSGSFKIVRKLSTRVAEMQEIIDNERPEFLHFAGHGDADGRPHFENADGTAGPVSIEAFVGLLALTTRKRGPIDLAVLNACHSRPMAEAFTKRRVARFAIGMAAPISDEAAVIFSDALYRALHAGHDVCAAFEFGINAIQLHERVARQSQIPTFFHAEGEDPRTVLVPR